MLKLQARGYFTEQQRTWPIFVKEMFGCLAAVQSFRDYLKDREVEFQTDNKAAERYLAKGGGPDPIMNEMTKQIHMILGQMGASVYTAVWIRGATENCRADALSRWIDPDDWELTEETLQRLRREIGPWTIDRFASDTNAKAKRFNSLLFCPGTEAVNCFREDWQGEVNLLVPPLYLVYRTIRHLIERRAVGLIVVPKWEGQLWWPLLQIVSTKRISLGTAWQFARPGPSGVFEPAKQRWFFEAHAVDGSRFHLWMSLMQGEKNL
jgi:hypothetical protein